MSEMKYELNDKADNALVVCHALTGTASLTHGGVIYSGQVYHSIQTSIVVCANVLGSCYGSTGPTSINPKTGMSYGGDFPHVPVRIV